MAIPTPTGMQFLHNTARKKLQVVLDDSFARRLRRVHGFVAEIQLSVDGHGDVFPPGYLLLLLNFSCLVSFFISLSPPRGSPTPGALQVLVMLHWRYGDSVTDQHDIFVYCRVTAFIAKSASPCPARCVKEVRNPHRLWGRDRVDIATWKAIAPNTSPPPPPWGFSGDSIFMIPQLGDTDFVYGRVPNINSAPLAPPHLLGHLKPGRSETGG